MPSQTLSFPSYPDSVSALAIYRQPSSWRVLPIRSLGPALQVIAEGWNASALGSVRRVCGPDLLRQLAGEADDLQTSSRIFGEDLPAGFVLANV